MKTLLAVAIVALAGTEPARADCGCGAWLLTERVVEGRPYVVIETACPAKTPTLSLADPTGKSVPLKLLSSHDGYGSKQLVFAPDQPIGPGTHEVTLKNSWEVTKHPLTVVGAPSTTSPPRWSGAAKVLGQEQVEFGCGPAKSVKVEAGTDASLAFVELVDDKSARRTSGYVRVDKGALSIGHGMCSGAFSLVKGRSYTAMVTLIAPERGTSSTSKQVSFTYAP